MKSNAVKCTSRTFCSAIVRLSIFGIWYLFLRSCLLSSLDSNANFTLPSFFTVITIGETKCLSQHFCSFIIWLSVINRCISLSTLSCRLIGTRCPFCCTGFINSKISARSHQNPTTLTDFPHIPTDSPKPLNLPMVRCLHYVCFGGAQLRPSPILHAPSSPLVSFASNATTCAFEMSQFPACFHQFHTSIFLFCDYHRGDEVPVSTFL